MGFLNIIRQKSDSQKSLFSIVTALVLTFFVVALWFSFSNNSSDDQVNNDKLSSISPMQVIKEEFSKMFSVFDSNISDSASSSPIIVEIVPDLATSSGTSTKSNTEISTTSKK